MILNNSSAIYVDGKMAERVYADGELVWGLPIGFEPVKYLEFSGHQWIDTGFIPEVGDEVYVKFIFPVSLTAVYSAGTGTYQLILIGPYFRYFSNTAASRDATRDRLYSFLLKGSGEAVRRRLEPLPPVTSVITDLIDIEKGAVNTNLFIGKRADGSQYYVGKVYNFSVKGKYESIPVIQKSTNKPGLFDLVTKTFFANSGSREFGYELMDGTYVAPI